MAAVVSREHVKGTWLTGLAGLVILAVALVMMACAAPSLAHPRPRVSTAQPASVAASSLITRNGPASGAGRPGQGGRAG